jgi:5-methylcytosine-specific restriction protein A
MRPPRPCLDCGALTRNPAGRCRPHELAHQKARNEKRRHLYGGTWQARSRAARKTQPWCSLCGTPYDLTLDHEHGQVECRACNASHRRDAS